MKDVCTSRRDNCVPCMDKFFPLNCVYTIRNIPLYHLCCKCTGISPPTNQNPKHNTVNSARTINFLNLFSTVNASCWRENARVLRRTLRRSMCTVRQNGWNTAFKTNHNNQKQGPSSTPTSNNIYTYLYILYFSKAVIF